jgi:hypothetical protein
MDALIRIAASEQHDLPLFPLEKLETDVVVCLGP